MRQPGSGGTTVQVRCRDIPIEEAECYGRGLVLGKGLWEKARGKLISIYTPQLEPTASLKDSYGCAGPLFEVAGITPIFKDDTYYFLCVCPHVAEIGD